MDQHAPIIPARFTALAVAFELSLGLLGILLGYLTGPSLWEVMIPLSPAAAASRILAGVATALLLFAGIVLVDRHPLGLFRQLQQTVRQHVVPLFRGASTWELLLISVAAGVGEELLFRGYCQAAMAHWLAAPWGNWGALLLASVLFGLCHWISGAYAIVATAMGLLLGGLFLGTGHLAAPVVAHALYDFLALLYLTRRSA